ncbi:hypothetical protein HPP92_024896 [Vanilla planifolia]|uniref:Uncharacterized protein n=1 Tax=Vanilla planifolia TaxID=51239 RepID=A0A835U9P2_VANPL|nr:hypothetical protein HPP92_024896 [Vanilla planifolia]
MEIPPARFHPLENKVTPKSLLRDEVGIGGSWNDFVHYFAASLSEGNVQLILGGVDDLHSESDAKHAKLIAHKSKGLPRISLSLGKLVNLSAKGVTVNIPLALFKALKSKQNDIVKGQEQLSRMEEMLSSERERNRNLQKQLDAFSFSSKRKASKISEKSPNIPENLENNDLVVSKAEQSSANTSCMEKQSQRDAQHIKGSQRAVPAYRRSKVRGVSLRGNEDDDGS